MSRIVWSVGGTGVLLACLAVASLQRPLELPASPEVLPTPPAHAMAPSVAPTPRPAMTPVPTPPREREPPPPEEVAPMPSAPPAAAPRARARRVLPETRVRLVKALRADHPTPLARRDAVLAELAASGDSEEAWTAEARAALDTWRTRITEDVLPIHAEAPRCYAGGCVARVTFPDAASFQEAWERSPGLRLGEGSAHLQLPPEHLPTGEVRVPWIVLRPDHP